MDYDETSFDFEFKEQDDDESRAGAPVELRRVLFTVAGKWKQLLIGAGVGLVLAGLGLLLMPETYTSTSRLVYDGVIALDGEDPDDKLVQGLAVIESSKNATRLREVRQALGLEVTVRELEERLQVEAGIDDNSMTVRSEADTPIEAQQITETFVTRFLKHQTASVGDRLAAGLKDTEMSLEASELRLKEAREAHEVFQKESGKADLLADRKRLLARVAKLNEQADAAAIEASGQRARVVELEEVRKDMPKQVVATATRGSVVDAPLAKARADLAKAEAAYSDDHPRVRALRNRVAKLEAQRKKDPKSGSDTTMAINPTREAVSRAVAEAKAAVAAAEQKEKTLRELAAGVQKDANALGSLEAEARRVEGELKMADARVKALDEKVVAIRDAGRSPTSGFRVLAPASFPEEPDRSGVLMLLLLMLPFVGGFAVGLVHVTRELRGFFVHTPAEVAWWGRGPVLGTTTWPGESKALESFVDEMEDHGIRGIGQTLVVPATEAERDVACTIAVRLGEAPWLAAAILDVDEWRASYRAPHPLITPNAAPVRGALPSQAGPARSPSGTHRTPSSSPPGSRPSSVPGRSRATPSQPFRSGVPSQPSRAQPRSDPGEWRGGSRGRGPTPSYKPTIQGFAAPTADEIRQTQRRPITTPPPMPAPLTTPPPSEPTTARPSRPSAPPRKKTMIGIPSSMPPGTPSSPSSPPPRKQTIVGIPSSIPPSTPSHPSASRPTKQTMVGMPASVPSPALVPDEAREFEQSPDETPIPLSRISSNPPAPDAGSASSPESTSSASSSSSAAEIAFSSGPPGSIERVGRAVEGVARAVVRMVVRDTDPTEALEDSEEASGEQEQAFLLTRRTDARELGGDDATPRAVRIGEDATPSSKAVMRAAVRVLSDDKELLEGFEMPAHGGADSEPPPVVLAWNGPLTGPVVRRAARLSHRVMVVVSAGMSALELSRMHTRLGRDGGIGYVLVNLDPRFVEYEDRVGDVEEFWEGSPPGLRQSKAS